MAIDWHSSSPPNPHQTARRAKIAKVHCVLTGYESYGTRTRHTNMAPGARRASDASGISRRGHAPSRRQHGPRA
eukprot:6286019-Prymnesium_polylepis.2